MGIPEPDVTVKPGDVEKGAKIFKTKCAQCHNAEQVLGFQPDSKRRKGWEGGGREDVQLIEEGIDHKFECASTPRRQALTKFGGRDFS